MIKKMDEETRANQADLTTKRCLFLNILLTAIKFIAGSYGLSTALVADAIHSLTDSISDIVVIIAFKLTKKPADECHNYGHGKYETLASLFITLTLIIASITMFYSGLHKILLFVKNGYLTMPKAYTLYIAAFSIAIKEAMYRYTLYTGKKINSSAMIANAWHHRTDALTSVAAFIGIGMSQLFGKTLILCDPIISILMSFFVLKTAIKILIPSVNELLDGSINDDYKKSIIRIIRNQKNVKDFHKIRTRNVGNSIVIDFHILVDPNLNIIEAHNIAHEVEDSIKNTFIEQCCITIHVEPYFDGLKDRSILM